MADRNSTDPSRAALATRVQIAVAVFLPLLLLTVWLGSKGFFTAP